MGIEYGVVWAAVSVGLVLGLLVIGCILERRR